MRKNFNRFLVLICVALLSAAVAFLTACVWDPSPYYYNLEELRAPVTRIELINYDNPNQHHFKSWVPNHEGDLKPLNMDAIEVTATMDDSQIDSFMQDLSKELILYKFYDVDSPKDTCIRIVYEDDYFDILSKNYVGTFTPSGKVEDFIGSFSGYIVFEHLLQTYFGS